MFNHIENRQNEIRNNILNSFNDADDMLEKGGKPAQIGEKRMFSGREYVKTANGWKFHGKGTGTKAKEHVSGTKKTSLVPISDEEKIKNEELGKTYDNNRDPKLVQFESLPEREESKGVDHKKEAEIWANELHTPTKLSHDMTMSQIDEKQAYHERQAVRQNKEKPEENKKKDKDSYSSDMSDYELEDRLQFHQKKEKESQAKGKSYEHHSKVRELEKEWSKRNAEKGNKPEVKEAGRKFRRGEYELNPALLASLNTIKNDKKYITNKEVAESILDRGYILQHEVFFIRKLGLAINSQ